MLPLQYNKGIKAEAWKVVEALYIVFTLVSLIYYIYSFSLFLGCAGGRFFGWTELKFGIQFIP